MASSVERYIGAFGNKNLKFSYLSMKKYVLIYQKCLAKVLLMSTTTYIFVER